MLNNDNASEHAKLKAEKSPGGLNTIQRTIGKQGKLGAGEVAFSREEHENFLSNVKPYLHTSNILQTD